jgi:hypothetical protein
LSSTYVVRRPVLNSYLVRQRDRKRRQELGLVLVIILPLAIGLLGYVWLNLELIDSGYEVHDLERTLKQEGQLRRELSVEAAYLSSPAQVQSRASTELGMVPTTLDRLIFLEEIP